MVESVGLVSTLVEEHKHGGGSREEKDLALIIVIILPEISYLYLPYFTLETIPFSFRELNTDSEA